MYPRNGKIVCERCGIFREMNKKGAVTIKKEKKVKKKPVVLDRRADGRPLVKMACPKCSNKEAYAELRQVRAADEPETQFYTCTKCGHRWRVN